MNKIICNNCGKELNRMDREKIEKRFEMTVWILGIIPVLTSVIFMILQSGQYVKMIESRIGLTIINAGIFSELLGIVLLILILKSKSNIRKKHIYLIIPTLFFLTHLISVIVGPSLTEFMLLLKEL